jgi:redox-sensitive bicupin YhaK (pirin superfamily)
MQTTDQTTPQRPVTATVAGQRQPEASFLVASFGGAPGWMDPFLNVDHFLMDEPTFRPHAHAGFSAVTVIFEDSPGAFRNRDSLGTDLTLDPGALHWTRAGSGIQHEEVPTVPGVAVHGAQIFVALPPELERTDPQILHLDAAEAPTRTTPDGVRIRTLVGPLDDAHGVEPGHDVTLLDVTLPPGRALRLDPGTTRTCFVVAIAGRGQVNGHPLDHHHAIGLEPGDGVVVVEGGPDPLHVLIGGGTPLARANHWIGGIAMSTPERSAEAASRYRRGEFGDLAPSF